MVRHRLFFTVLIFLLAVSLACEKHESSGSAKTTRQDKQQLGRMLSGMGISKISKTGTPVDISLQDIKGKTVRLSDFRGKIVFLNFWTTWCAECRVEMPSMEILHQRLKGNDFVMISVDIQEPADLVKSFLQKNKLTFRTLLDSNGEVMKRFKLRGIPATFIIDKQGRFIGKALGGRKWNSKKSVDLFEYLINQPSSK